MENHLFVIGDLKQRNITWNYERLQINIPNIDTDFPLLHEDFDIKLKFKEGVIINNKGKCYTDGVYKSRIVKDQHNRFGKNIDFAICAIWQTKIRDGLLIGWLKDHKLVAGDKVRIIKQEDIYILEPY